MQLNNSKEQTLKKALELVAETDQEIWLAVRGDSMVPLIRDGDKVLVVLEKKDIRRGEIVVYQRDGELIFHRLLAVYTKDDGNYQLLTKGDNRLTPDPLVNFNELTGRAISIRRGEQQLRLDRSVWQGLNRVVGIAMFGITRVFLSSQAARLRWIGGQPLPVLSFLGKVSQGFIVLVLRLVGFLFSRWR